MPRLLQSSPYSGTYDASLKQFYDGAMQSLVPDLFPILDWLKSEGRVRKVTPKGNKIYFATTLKLSSGFDFRGENDYLPAADQVDTIQGSVPYQVGMKGRIQLSFESLKFGKEGVGGFVNVSKQEMTSALHSMRQSAAPALWGLGDGVLAKIAQISGSTAIVPDSSELSTGCYPGSRWLHEGKKYIGVTSTAAGYGVDTSMTAANENTVISSDTSATFEDSCSTDGVDYLVSHECTDSSSATERAKGSVTLGTANSFRGPQGMLAMCDDGTLGSSYCGISESSYPQWKATVSDNSGNARSLSLDLFYQLYWKMTRKAGDFNPNLTSWMNTDMHRKLTDLLEHFVEFKPRELKPGFKAYDMMINNQAIPIRLDHYCPGYIFFLNPAEITFAEGCPPSVAGETGSMWRQVADKDMYEAVYRWIFQTYTRSRNKHGILMDLTYDVTSV